MDPVAFPRALFVFFSALAIAGAYACSSEGAGSPTAGSPGSGPIGSGSVISCDTSVACPSAKSIGTISGDTRNDSISADGTTSTWLHFGVTEDDDNWDGRPVHFRAMLTSPPSASFELHAYVDLSVRDDAGLDCVHDVARSAPVPNGAVLDFSWGDPPDGSANGYDDGRTVALEVRNVSGACAASAPWHLDVRGN